MSYYYLISGLPDLSLAEDAKGIVYEEVLDTIARNLTEGDQKIFDYLLLANDNQNLISVIANKHHGLTNITYQLPSKYSSEEINEFNQLKHSFPDYLSSFIAAYEDQFAQLTLVKLEQLLNDLYLQEVDNKDDFLNTYLTFSQELDDFFAAYNYSHHNFLEEEPAVFQSLLLQLGPGKSIPSSLVQNYPFVEKIGSAIESGNPWIIQDLKDSLLWDFVEMNTGFFTLQQVLSYTVKIIIAYRRAEIRKDTGLKRFNQLKDQLKENVQLPIMTSI